MISDAKCWLTAEPAATASGVPAFGRYGLVGLVAGLAVVAGAVAGGATFVSHLPGAWFFGTPRGPLGSVGTAAARPPAVAVLGVYGGLSALAVLWWRLLRALRGRPGTPVRQVVKVVAAWAVPFVVAPPLFSRDVYSYAGQGQMVSFHINPYLYGPGVLGATPFNLLAGPLWANTPSPYGPTFLSLDGLATAVSGHQVLADIFLLRLLAVAGIALVVAGLPTLARSVGRDPATAVVLGAGSPLVLATLIGGAHNDALMVGLLVAGLAAWQRYGPVPGIVLCALAGGVKVPALLGVVVIGWNWAPVGASVWRRMRRTLAALGLGAVTLGVVSAVSGVGWGWVTTVTAPDKVYTGVTPVDALSHGIAGVLDLVGTGVSLPSVRGVASIAGVVVALAVGSWLVWHSPRLGAVRAAGLAMLAVSLLSPVLWAWYVTWGLVLLAPVAAGGTRRLLVWLTVAETLIGAASVLGILKAMVDMGPLTAAMVALGVAAMAVATARPSYEQRPKPWAGRRRRPPGPAGVPGVRQAPLGR